MTIPPVAVTLIGTGTGDGAPIPSGSVLVTPDHQPNVIINVITPIAAIFIRFVNTYLITLVGLVAASMTTNVIPYNDFVALLIKCAGLALPGAGVGLLKDLITIFGKLEQRYPLMTGNV